jgi:cerevisin
MQVFLYASYAIAASNYIVLFHIPEAKDRISMLKQMENNISNVTKKFSFNDIVHKRLRNGFKGQLSPETKEALSKDPSIAVIEEDFPVKIAETKYLNPNDNFPQTHKNNSKIESANSLFTSLLFGMPLFKNIKQKGHKPMKSNILLAPFSMKEKLDVQYQVNEDLLDDSAVAHFEIQKDAPWGICKVSGHNSEYEYVEDPGKNVSVYVLDTGIQIENAEFENRASWGYNAVPNSLDTDENGHGTHCSGTIAGKTYGIAKKANLVAVKVLNKNGEGMISSLIEGIDFVIKDHERRLDEYYEAESENFFNKHGLRSDKDPSNNLGIESKKWDLINDIKNIFGKANVKPVSIVNMSVGGDKSRALNFAIAYATKTVKIHFSVAAGNDHKDACDYSPSSSSNSMTVGASDIKNQVAFFSNTGKCVDIFAPGVDIMSAWIDNQKRVASGTSMAAPHVSGVMAIYASLSDFTPNELKERILKDSIRSIEYPNARLYSIFKSSEENKQPMVSLRKLYDRLKDSTE